MVGQLRRLLPGVLLLLVACPSDREPPGAAIARPAPGDTVSGLVAVDCRATDNREVRSVEFYVDGALGSRVTTASGDVFSWQWDTRPLAPGGRHVLRCAAYDAVGNQGLSDTVAVYIGLAGGTHHSGTISTPETWSADGNPHVVDSDVAAEADLTILPGARVYFTAGTGITVGARSRARFVAAGTVDSAILFTAIDTVAGPWRAVELRPLADTTSRFEYCRVDHGGAGAEALLVGDVPFAVRNCELHASRSRGAWARTAFASFRDNAISGCAGLPVRVGLAGPRSVGTGNAYSANLREGIEVAGGQVTASDTWPAPGVPLCFTGTVTIADTSNPQIHVAAGCSLLLADSCRLRVGVARPGGIRADGAYGRITFSALSAEPGPGRWGGIEFWESTDSFRTALRLCTIERAGTAGGAAISLLSAPVGIANCIIRDNAAVGVHCFSTGPGRFEYNTVTGCGSYPLRLPAQFVTRLGPGNSLTGNAVDAIGVSAGTIAQRAEWRDYGLPYVVNGIIDVGAAGQPAWVIEGGTELRFEAGAGVRVGLTQPGEIIAVGDPDSITFTGTASAPGAWRGVELHAGAMPTTVLDRCRILYAGAGERGNLLVSGCTPTIRDCEIGWSSNYCVWLLESELDPDSLRQQNWLHDWAEGFEDIFEDGR